MSTDTQERGSDRRSATLFDESQMPIPEPRRRSDAPNAGVARVMAAQRDRIELRACDLDSLLGSDHAARTVWAFVQSLDLGALRAKIKAVEHGAGRPAIDPAILVALWLWATIDGVGSAREIDRLCERDDAYRWVCGGVGVNYHTLAEFRTRHVEWLDAQLTRSIASLLERKLVTLSVVSQDGMRVRASAKAASFRRRGRLEKFMHEARAQVTALKAELDEDAGAGTRRKQAARERAAREREERLTQALATMHEIEAREPEKKKRTQEAKGGDRDVPPGGKPPAAEAEPRVSTTDPEARVMKMADGGFRPAFNAQLAVDTATQLIAGADLVNIGSDMGQMVPMHEQIEQRYGHTPGYWLADGGYSKLQAIDEVSQRGTKPVLPPPRSKDLNVDPFAPKSTDSPNVAQWRTRMASDAARALYKQRAATIECTNAQIRRRGLYRFLVRGRLKARGVLLWHALAHNLMRMRSLNIAFQT